MKYTEYLKLVKAVEDSKTREELKEALKVLPDKEYFSKEENMFEDVKEELSFYVPLFKQSKERLVSLELNEKEKGFALDNYDKLSKVITNLNTMFYGAYSQLMQLVDNKYKKWEEEQVKKH